jgi:broad specificity phosphatase PhoE
VSAPPQVRRIVLVRHGETEWSATGRHTSRTDVPLTDRGRSQAEALGGCLQGWRFALVLTSPLQRAAETCRVAGFGDLAQTRPELVEWDYGDYEGLTTPQIRERRPGWSLWSDGAPGGETAAQVARRADRVLAEVREVGGDVALFSHGHFLRVAAARWIDLPAETGGRFALDTASISVLGYERETPVIARWNQPC